MRRGRSFGEATARRRPRDGGRLHALGRSRVSMKYWIFQGPYREKGCRGVSINAAESFRYQRGTDRVSLSNLKGNALKTKISSKL